METNQNRILLSVVIAVLIVGGITIWRQREAKAKTPVFGWHTLGSENFELKPSGYRGFSYRQLPSKFRVTLRSSQPVAFGFVTPDTFGRYTSTVLPVEFASLPCGTASTTSVDLNCATQPEKRYLLLVDTREDPAPEPSSRKGGAQKKAETAAPGLPQNEVSIAMYDWRCIEHCENLPAALEPAP